MRATERKRLLVAHIYDWRREDGTLTPWLVAHEFLRPGTWEMVRVLEERAVPTEEGVLPAVHGLHRWDVTCASCRRLQSLLEAEAVENRLESPRRVLPARDVLQGAGAVFRTHDHGGRLGVRVQGGSR